MVGNVAYVGYCVDCSTSMGSRLMCSVILLTKKMKEKKYLLLHHVCNFIIDTIRRQEV